MEDINVYDYLVAKLGPVPDDPYEGLRDFPVESECGEDCVRAIDAGRALLDEVHKANGGLFYPEVAASVKEATLHVVSVFAFG